MHTRFAALLLALGLADVGYLNLAVGPDVFLRDAGGRDVGQRAVEPSTARAALREEAPREARSEPEKPAAGSPGLPALPTLPAPDTDEGTPAPEAAPLADGATQTALADDTALVVRFPETATSTLPSESLAELRALAARLIEHPDQRLRVIGHADARGSRGFNRYLGARRARAVTDVLLSAGVPRKQIEARSHGEDEPRASGESESAWAQNRRVEISLDGDRSNTP